MQMYISRSMRFFFRVFALKFSAADIFVQRVQDSNCFVRAGTRLIDNEGKHKFDISEKQV